MHSGFPLVVLCGALASLVALRSAKACLVFLVAGVVFLVVNGMLESDSSPASRPGLACASARATREVKTERDSVVSGKYGEKSDSRENESTQELPGDKSENPEVKTPLLGAGVTPSVASSLLGEQLESRWRTPNWREFYTSHRSALEEAMTEELDSAGNRDPAWREIGGGGGGCPLPPGTY